MTMRSVFLLIATLGIFTTVISPAEGVDSCSVNNREYDLGSDFTFDDGCYRFNCKCKRDGSWNCPAKNTINLCGGGETISRSSVTSVESSRSRSLWLEPGGAGIQGTAGYCHVDGKKFARGRPFSFDQECYRFRCICNADGSWNCPAKDTENLCGGRDTAGRTSSSSSSRGTSIVDRRVEKPVSIDGIPPKYCNVKGQQFPLGREFTFDENCFRYSCTCEEDGSWECPPDTAVQMCAQTRGDSIHNERSRTRDVASTGLYCDVSGQTYIRGEPFSYDQGCYRFNCFCNDDGSWNCPAEDTEDICNNRGGNSRTETRRTNSGGNSRTETRRTETRRTETRVSHDTYGRRTSAGRSTREGFCNVKGLTFTRGRGFSFDEGCYRFNCMCNDDGSWNCPARDTEDICGDRDLSRGTETRRTETQRSKFRSIKGIARGTYTVRRESAGQSGYCVVNGKNYVRGRTFSFDQGCYRFNCKCNADGSWNCPATDTEDLCDESGGVEGFCLVKGKRYVRGRTFSFDQGCYRFNCKCNDDGSWNCPASDTDDLCTDREKDSRRTETSRTETSRTERYERTRTGSNRVVNTDTDNVCLVQGQPFPRGQPFSFDDGCYRFRCICNTDGSWNCPAQDTQNLCGGTEQVSRSGRWTVSSRRVVNSNRRTGTVGTGVEVGSDYTNICLVNGQSYRRGRPFSFDQDCYRFRCMCNTDGSWNCPAEQTENLCGGTERVSRSGQTIVTRRKIETGRTRVETGRTGVETGRTGVEVGTDVGNICLVNGRSFSRGRPFSFDDGCYRFRCMCHSDGSWECPARDTENLCGGTEKISRSGRTTITRTRTEVNSGGSRTRGGTVDIRGPVLDFCQVNNRKYAIREPFTFDDGCYRFRCLCNEDGSWNCPASATENLCGGTERISRSGRTSMTSTRVRSTYTRGTGETAKTGTVAAGIACQVDGRRYTIGQPFSFDQNCFRFRCICNLDGSWVCPAEQTENICGGTERISRSGIYRVTETNTRIGTVGNTGGNGRRTVGYCLVNGKEYPLNRAFTFQEDCFKFQCFCNRNGAWDCPSIATKNLCGGTERIGKSGVTRLSSRGTIRRQGTTGTIERAKFCLVDNKEYQLNRPFGFDQGCHRYKCFCSSDGSWDCPAADSKNICGGTDKRGRSGVTYYRRVSSSSGSSSTKTRIRQGRYCSVAGQYYRVNSRFSYRRGCSKFNCVCNSDGSFNCPASQTEDLCATEPKYCTVEGKNYQLNTRFSYTKGCVKYNCICRANGNHECPARNREDICDNDDEPRDKLGYCLVKGQYYRKNSRFSYREDCYKYNCVCSSDGSYNCPASQTENVCERKEDKRVFCYVRGKYHRPNTRFAYTTGCNKHNCVCKADGSHDCPRQDIEQVCQNSTTARTGTYREGYCHVEGQYYRWDSRFSYTKGCLKFHCHCTAKGRVDCPAASTEKLCEDRTPAPARCYVEGRYYGGNTRFTYAKDCYIYTCTCSNEGKHECATPRKDDRCEKKPAWCLVEGKYYRINTRFSYVKDCYKHSCVCKSDASYDCPSSDVENVCTAAPTPRPDHCIVAGQYYRLNTRFSYRRGCTKFNCFCRSDGTFECPNSEDMCQQTTADPRAGHCRVRGSASYYPPNKRFTYDRGCTRYSCWCGSNGKHTCPEEDKVDLCATPRPTPAACRTCEVDGRVFQSRRSFSYQRDCYQYGCDCNCDGTWNCPAERTKYICPGGGSGEPQCETCKVKGRIYQGDSDFKLREGCYELNCRCRCDGVWDCPPEQGVNLCPTAAPVTPDPNLGVCRYCVVRGQQYAPENSFSYYEGCFEYHCDCDCSGTWNCPADRTKNICDQCKDCRVNGRTYKFNTNFELQRGCAGYDCTCFCNGTHDCPISTKRDTCDVVPGCSRCKVNDVEYPPNRRFNFVEACFEYDCDCECDGSWHCPEDRTKTICTDSVPDGGVGRPSNCGTCKIGVKNYQGNSRFKHAQECFEFICDCNCDGSWDCDPKLTKNLCEDGEPADSARLFDVETCKLCEVSGVTYASQKPFTYQRECLERECFCHCDGTWTCPSERDVCDGDTSAGGLQAIGCKVKGKVYKTQKFSFVDGCFEYNCDCENGSYDCPAARTKNIC